MAVRRKKPQGGIAAESGSDYGPSLRSGRDGRLRAWGGAAVVEVEYRDDPSVPQRRRIVRGARRRNGLVDLVARNTITKRMRDAAEQFLDDCSLALGASSAGLTGMPVQHGAVAAIPERQLSAIGRVRQVCLIMQASGVQSVFLWVVFDNGGLREWELAQHVQPGRGSAMLRDALESLDAHYNTGRRQA